MNSCLEVGADSGFNSLFTASYFEYKLGKKEKSTRWIKTCSQAGQPLQLLNDDVGSMLWTERESVVDFPFPMPPVTEF